MSIIKNAEGIVLSGKEREKVLNRIYTMLCMTGDCCQINLLVDGTKPAGHKRLRDVTREDINELSCGYLVATYSYNDVEASINGKDTEQEEKAITVVIIDSDGSSVVGYNWDTSEVTLWEGSVEQFMETSENYILAW